MIGKALLLSLPVFLAFSYSGVALAGTWYVNNKGTAPRDGQSPETGFGRIQDGIDAASDGDTVTVSQGAYLENIRFVGKNLILRSKDPSDAEVVANTVIDGSQAGSVVTFSGAEEETCVLTGFTITGGKIRTGAGAGICGGSPNYHTHAIIVNNVITYNAAVADARGGGLAYCDGLICDNTISRNYGEDGGALYDCDGIIQCNIVVRNSAGSRGGGLYRCDGVIKNNVMARNRSSSGGGLDACDAAIQNNTIAMNEAEAGGGGLSACVGTIRDCIIWGNRARVGEQLHASSEPTYCCTEGWSGSGEGNIALNPHFVEPAESDFHLRSWSPCIDAGDPNAPFSNEPEPNGGQVNMGAYGNTAEAASRSSDMDSDGLPDDWELYFFTSLEEASFGDPDADHVTNDKEYRYAWDPTVAAETTVENRTKAEWYQTLQAALSESGEGDEMIAYPGVFYENIRFLGKNVVLRSTDPWQSSVVATTIIDGGGLGSVVSLSGTENESCVIAGFTIRNGKGTCGGGICGGTSDHHTRATIRNNIVCGNLALDGGGLCYCDGLILNNVVCGNQSWEDGEGGGLYDCDGTIENCTVSDNSASEEGGGLCECNGSIRNCILWGNTAANSDQLYQSSQPTYSCIQYWTDAGTGNIALNPHFVDAANRDFHLPSWSPCIDAGDPTSPITNEPQPNGGCINIGAYGNTPQAASRSQDTDSDGLPDGWELYWYSNMARDGAADPDGDGIPDSTEYVYGRDPTSSDEPRVGNPSKGTWYLSIGAALSEANQGEEIVLYPGTYVENIALGGKDIVLRSTDPSQRFVVEKTIIDGGRRGPVISFAGTESDNCVLEGLTLRHGKAEIGAGICGGTGQTSTSATIRNNLIIRNLATKFGGAGLAYCDGLIENNVIEENEAAEGNVPGVPSRGGGVLCCDGTIRYNTISRNSADDIGGGLANCQGTIHNNTIMWNWTGGSGGGVAACQGTIRNNTFTGNSAGGGGGLSDCGGIVENNIIAGNKAKSNGGGLSRSGGTIRNNAVCRNSCGDEGGGLFDCDGTIVNNTICDNSADDYGGGLSQCSATIQNCIIWGNTAWVDQQLHYSSWPTYSCVQGCEEESGNISRDPCFLDNDYRLHQDSPCIDAGSNHAAGMPETDIGGLPRILYGGRRAKPVSVDMGAYEYFIFAIANGSQGNFDLTWSSRSGKTYAIYFSYDLRAWVLADGEIVSAGNLTTSWVDDGSKTDAPPHLVPVRFYRLEESP